MLCSGTDSSYPKFETSKVNLLKFFFIIGAFLEQFQDENSFKLKFFERFIYLRFIILRSNTT